MAPNSKSLARGRGIFFCPSLPIPHAAEEDEEQDAGGKPEDGIAVEWRFDGRIDVEGAEWLVIEGARGFLRRDSIRSVLFEENIVPLQSLGLAAGEVPKREG